MKPVKLLFDECLGRPHVEFLARLFHLEDPESRPEIKHLLEIQSQGVPDEVWIPRVANEDWILISGDKSRFKKGKGEPLSRTCVKHGITHVLLSPVVSARKVFDKMLTILSVWYQIVDLQNVPRGARYVIEPAGRELADRCKGKLIERPPQQNMPRPVPPGTLPFTE